MSNKSPEEKLADAKIRVREAFITFEHREGSRLVDVKDLPSVIRSLGINPSGAQLKTFTDTLASEEGSSHVTLDSFENAAAKFVLDHEAKVLRDDYHTLVRAFKAFDPEEKGYIDADVLKNALLSQGECFTQDEINSMMAHTVDDENNRLYYEDYAAKLANDGRKL